MGLKALLVGINRYEQAPLQGCVNDVTRLRELLQQQYGLADEQLRVLLDGAATQQAITDGLHWLAEPDGSASAPVRLFHFSGHGVQVANLDGSEPDGRDEAIVPYDYQTAGVMRDKLLRTLYNRFADETHLLLTMDCCHSGDIHFVPPLGTTYRFLPINAAELDLVRQSQELFFEQQQRRLAQLEQELLAQGISGAELKRRIQEAAGQVAEKQHFGRTRETDIAVLIAACRSDQTAADAFFDHAYHGALTYYLTSVLRETGGRLTYSELIERVGQVISENKFSQVPQLYCSPPNRNRLFLAGIGPGQSQRSPTDTPPVLEAAQSAARQSSPRASKEMPPELPPEFFDNLLPLVGEKDAEGVKAKRAVDPGLFLYIGKGLHADEFTAYVESYQFGSQPPNYIVLHHTYIPDTLSARALHASWDSHEEGLTEQQIYNKRLNQLYAIKEHYRIHLGWDRGPHLFIDDRWIWLFTPMYHMGIHAGPGNGYRAGGNLNYSIGIEVIGNYSLVRWPAPVEALVGHAVAVLKRRLGTFEITYRPLAGGISSHRDYNKSSCPGDAITEEYYIGVLERGWQRLLQSQHGS